MKTFKELFEKKLTPAEMKKREEIATAMERENPDMEMGKKMAIATAAAKRVAEETELDEAVHTNLSDWETHAKKLGYKVTKDNKTATYHAWKETTHKGSFKSGSGSGKVEEAYMSSDRSKQMFKRKELDHELRHEVEPKRAEPADPHAVHINGKKWKTFPTKSHATNVAKKIAGATVVKESIDEGKIPEMRYSEVMKKIKSGTHEATHDVKPGKHVELRHIDSGKKTTVYVKESSELDEATDYHDQAQEHKKKSDKAMDKNDMEAYHHHMSNYHEALGQWEESKGRSSNAQKHYVKAEGHHELSLKKNEGTDMLSFKYFQEMLEEAKKKCKESSSEIELAHGEMLDKDEENGKEKKEMYVKEGEAPVVPVPGTKSKTHAIMVHPESKQRVTIPRKNVKNYPASEGWKEVAPGMKESVEELDEAELFYQHAKKLMDQGRDSHKPSSDAPYGRTFYGNAYHNPPGKSRLHVLDNGKKVKTVHVPDEHIEKLDTKGKLEWPDHMDPTIEKKHFDAYAKTNSRHISEPVKESVEELDEAAITHVVAKDKLDAHKEFMDKEGFDVTTKPLPKSHPNHATHMGIVSKNKEEDGYHESGNAHSVSESVEIDEALHPLAHKVLKHIDPKHHDKYIPDLQKGTKEKPGYTGSYSDRAAVLAAAEKAKHLVKPINDSVSPFDWKAYAKAKGPESSNKTKTFHDVKKTSTGTVYTKQVNPDGTSKGSGDDAAQAAEKADAPKRGRGRPAGVGAKTGSYKPRDPAAKAASAAKSAASKAANRAARNEEFDNEFMGSLIEGFEDEDFDEFLYCEEFDELDEATQEALINFINEKCASKMKESLTGNQHKLDKNKNGKIDSHDFKLLRKEETEQVQESVNTYAAFLTKKQ
jgi:hypothetical protein